MKTRLLQFALLLYIAAAPMLAISQSTPAATPAHYPAILNAAEAGAILPPSVYFQGQSAPIQARNSAGVRFSKDSSMLAAVVDTAGYSSAIAQRYQSYLITETTLVFEGHRLPPGAYGFGFIAPNGDKGSFVVMDLGGHDVLTASSTKDSNLRRPSPLQILPGTGKTGAYLLYSGRFFVAFNAVE